MQPVLLRALSVALIVPIICGFAWTGYASYMGAKHWAAFMVVSQAGHAGPTLATNLRAYEAFPLDPQYRRQLAGSLALVIQRHADNIDLHPPAADLIARVSRTVGPDDPSILIPRAEYLLNFGRWQEPEMRDLMRRLAGSASKLQSYWLLKGYWHAFAGERADALAAVAHGQAMTPVTVDSTKFAALKAALEKAE